MGRREKPQHRQGDDAAYYAAHGDTAAMAIPGREKPQNRRGGAVLAGSYPPSRAGVSVRELAEGGEALPTSAHEASCPWREG